MATNRKKNRKETRNNLKEDGGSEEKAEKTHRSPNAERG